MLCMGAENNNKTKISQTVTESRYARTKKDRLCPSFCVLASFAKRNALCEYYYSSLALLVIEPLTMWILYSNDTSSSRSLKLTT